MSTYTSSDTAQAAALSRALRASGWNPCPSGSARRADAGMIVRRGSCGLGASIMLSGTPSNLGRMANDLGAELTALGYTYERSNNLEDGFVRFGSVKKA